MSVFLGRNFSLESNFYQARCLIIIGTEGGAGALNWVKREGMAYGRWRDCGKRPEARLVAFRLRASCELVRAAAAGVSHNRFENA